MRLLRRSGRCVFSRLRVAYTAGTDSTVNYSANDSLSRSKRRRGSIALLVLLLVLLKSLKPLQKDGRQGQRVGYTLTPCHWICSEYRPDLRSFVFADDEPDSIDAVFEDLDEADNKNQLFKETKLTSNEYAWLALHINKRIDERRAESAHLVESEINVRNSFCG